MASARRPFSRRSASGTARIKRDGYSNMNVKWWDIRKEVVARDGGKCRSCGSPATEVHHILPLSRGGTTTKSNLISLCHGCHDKRHRHTLKGRK
jgi:5-methylcytosine-specific restriction endonuclease McrA